MTDRPFPDQEREAIMDCIEEAIREAVREGEYARPDLEFWAARIQSLRSAPPIAEECEQLRADKAAAENYAVALIEEKRAAEAERDALTEHVSDLQARLAACERSRDGHAEAAIERGAKIRELEAGLNHEVKDVRAYAANATLTAQLSKLVEAVERIRDATPNNTNSRSVESMASWTHAVAATALDALRTAHDEITGEGNHGNR